MKIIFLNCWYGQAGRGFFDFIKENARDTDCFCFQEVHPELFSSLNGLLGEFKGLYASEEKKEATGFVYGQAIFVGKCFKVVSWGKIDLYRQVINDVGFLHLAGVEIGEKRLFLGNVHGKARPGAKLDTPVRLRQSQTIIKSFAGKSGGVIIGGDFNLLPGTKSLKLFEEVGYRNLIKDFGIKVTRNKLAWEGAGKGLEKQYFADYVFTSKGIKVKNFSVPQNEISDHLPLILDFEV